MEKLFKLKCFKSLINAVGQHDIEIFVIGDCLTEETISSYKQVFPGLKILNSQEKLGNAGSLVKVYEQADKFTQPDEIIYFCEDDYLYREDFINNIVNFFGTTGNKFEDVFFHPTDYPDQYNDSRMRRNYVFNDGLNGWYKEIDSTTFTFACKVKTYQKYNVLLKDCAVRNKVGYDRMMKPIYHLKGADDARFSETFGYKNTHGSTNFHQSAICFCPLPGTASHMHSGTESLHFNWETLYKTISL
jgi:hypothetical protein